MRGESEQLEKINRSFQIDNKKKNWPKSLSNRTFGLAPVKAHDKAGAKYHIPYIYP